MKITINGTYAVNAEGIVKLSIVVGDAQSGYSQVYLDNVEVTKGAVISDFPLGVGKDLLRRTLTVDTQVTVVNPNTNHTSITCKLMGGKENKDYFGEAMASQIGDTVDYHTEIKFTS